MTDLRVVCDEVRQDLAVGCDDGGVGLEQVVEGRGAALWCQREDVIWHAGLRAREFGEGLGGAEGGFALEGAVDATLDSADVERRQAERGGGEKGVSQGRAGEAKAALAAAR